MKRWPWLVAVVGLALVGAGLARWLAGRRTPELAQDRVTRACESGDASACRSLVSTPQAACMRGSGAACRKLGVLLRDGDYPHRVNVDSVGATQAFERGCSLHDAASCTAWGDRLANGRGANVDTAAAQQAFARGCELGDSEGCTRK